MNTERDLITQGSCFQLTVHPEHEGLRIDKFMSNHFANYSRSFLQKLFAQNKVLINSSKIAKPGYSLKIGDQISVSFPNVNTPNTPSKEIPNDIGVEIIAKESDFFIIYKPAGLVVHPPNGTCQDIALTDWLTKTYDDIAHVGAIDRPGIVHRLDRDTSGLMIIPRTNYAHATITDMFKNRKIHKTYLALVVGHPPKEKSIDFYIGRHPSVRYKMHAFNELTKIASSRDALSHYKVIEYYKDFSLVEVKPVTGRTHQIRVHMAAIGHPVLGDHLYGSKSKLISRQALHAHAIEFEFNGKNYIFSAPLDQDLQTLINNRKTVS